MEKNIVTIEDPVEYQIDMINQNLAGTDTAQRAGPKRATAEGWLTPKAVRAGAWIAFAGAFTCGLYLVWHGGWPIVLIGLTSLAAGWAYTGGPRPISRGFMEMNLSLMRVISPKFSKKSQSCLIRLKFSPVFSRGVQPVRR